MGKSKISGGAYKYIQKFYGEQDMSYPDGMPGPNGDGEMGVKKYQPKKSGESYDMKEAYNKNMSGKARLHFLENAIDDKNKK